jgi:acetylornithine deacetylase
LDVNPEGEASEWTYPPFSGHVDPQTNTIYGRGAMDDKAGVAICLGLMRVIVEQQLSFDGDLIFQFVLEDEITGNGSLACLEAGHVADAAFILDGTRPSRYRSTRREYGVSPRIEGAASLGQCLPSGRERGRNAGTPATGSARALQRPQRNAPAALDGISEPVPVRRTWHVGGCAATFDSDRGERPVFRLPQFVWDGFTAEPVGAATDEFRALVRQIAQRHGIAEFRIGPSTGTSDMRHFAKRGIPCLLYGPGRGFNPHRPDEHFLLDDLPFMMKVYLDMVVDWCNVAR